MHFDSREDMIIFICKNQSGRRNLSEEQLSYLRGKEYEAEKVKESRNPKGNNQYKVVTDQSGPKPNSTHVTRRKVADRHHVGEGTIQRDSEFARAVDTIGDAAPEIRQKILSGEMCAPKKQIVEIAEKPEPERRTM